MRALNDMKQKEQAAVLAAAREEIDRIDRESAALFERRMQAVARIAAYKAECGLPILDAAREEEVIVKNTALIEDVGLRPYYAEHLRSAMRVSRRYQSRLIPNGSNATVLTVELGDARYDITVERGALARVRELFRLDRRVLIVTDEGVPAAYAETVAAACRLPLILTVKQGEASKSLETLERLLTAMLEAGFTRTDAVVAVGGGVVGDLAGFAAASFMRGIDFYNIPTTLLSQVDSSIGGKTAVNLAGVKNCVGAFYQPRAVIIDPDLLATLPARQLSAGLAEAIKMAATCDAALFRRMEEEELPEILDEIIIGSLRIKRAVVEQDEREGGLRRVLNFGHTLGHGYESAASLGGLLHGECVALGMLPLCSERVRARLLPVLEKAGLPTECSLPADEVLAPVSHDKKADGDSIRFIYVDEIGSFLERRMPITEFCRTVREKLV